MSVDLGERERKEAASSRRFPVSVSSETPVQRVDWQSGGQLFDEVLSHARGAVDLSRAPLPVLESHDRSKVNVGVVRDLKLDGKRLRGELVLGQSERAKELAADIADGIVTGISVGYTISQETRDEKAKRITATRWCPYEVSIVSVPADPSVGINRSASMDEQSATTTPPTDNTTPPEVLAERERASEIHALVTRARLGADFGAQLVRDGVPLEQARARILDALVVRDQQAPTNQHTRMDYGRFDAISPGTDYGEDFRRAAVDSLLIRSGIPVARPHAGARDLSGSVYDLARLSLSRQGRTGSRFGESRGPELIKRAMVTADFPAILAGALHASVRSGYESEPASHRAWVRAVPVPDFRTQQRPILGSAPSLAQVGEHGEYTDGYFTDEMASYSVMKYGRMVAISWEALVNDNLGAFLRVQPALGQAARRAEADTVYALFALNSAAGPTMQDGTALFHANHANLATSAAFDSAQLGAGRALLRKQQALGGGYLSLVPRYLVVPSERETAAEVLLANATRRVNTEKTTPEWIASLELVVEPRLANTAVYLAAEYNQIDTAELGLLEENMNGPVVEEEAEFRKDVKQWKVRHVFGAKFLDWRGVVKMPVT
ncbi:HK97 family phage prohead protease [Anaeromyxobacter dehalogenans]|nr:HK97 family phage prohead protease [Anaeromyxobacter dehalogenans]